MADQDPTDGLDDDIGPPGGKSNKMMLIIVAVNVVVIGGVGGFFFMGGGGSDAAAEEKPAVEETFAGPPILVEFDPFIANLNEPSAGRYIKLSIAVEVSGEKAKEAVEGRMAVGKHVVLNHLSNLSFSETQGEESKKILQKALQDKLNEAFEKDVVKNVYFTEFVIQ